MEHLLDRRSHPFVYILINRSGRRMVRQIHAFRFFFEIRDQKLIGNFS